MSEGFEHHEEDCGDQHEYREFVEPSKKHVAACIPVLLEVPHHAATPQMIGHQDEDQGEKQLQDHVAVEREDRRLQ